jgi:uncharacterized glyoxalase superfamily protein PhnB
MNRAFVTASALGLVLFAIVVGAAELPDTGVSGVYEAMVGTDDAEYLLNYFAEFGFAEVARASFTADQARAAYGVDSSLTSYRLQNGAIDSHGLVRILEWEKPAGPGVGYASPETIGQRMLVMRTEDIFRLNDIFHDIRELGEPVLPIPPVFADLYGMSEGAPGLFNRRVGVREMATYGTLVNHVFFQRYGYQIPGYGTIGDHSPLRTSELTHHDFVIKGDIDEVTAYYSRVLGFKPEAEDAVIDGDWQAGPKAVFGMAPGASHWYRGFVSPNDICGKLKFFVPMDPRPDRSDLQRPGHKGITLHSVTTPKLDMIHELALDHGLQVTDVTDNEFGERSFVISGPDGSTWQVIERFGSETPPVTEFQLVPVNN